MMTIDDMIAYEWAPRKGCLLYPDSRFLWVWDFLLGLAIVYLAFIMPVQIAFFEPDGIFYAMSEPGFTFVLLADIFINFFRVYANKRGKLVTSKAQIAKRYLSSWFWVDLIAFFPLFPLMGDFRNINNWAKVIKISKMFNLVELIRKAKILFRTCHSKKSDTLIGFRFFRTHRERFAMQVLGNLLLVHLVTCLIYAIPFRLSPDANWILARQLEDRSVFEKYLFALHWMVETCITVGYGEMPLA